MNLNAIIGRACRTIRLRSLIPATAVILVNCDVAARTEPEPPDPPIGEVIVSPATVVTYVNGMSEFVAVALTAEGDTVSMRISWTVNDGGAAIEDTGSVAKRFFARLRAGSTPGTYTVTAQEAGGKAGTASLTVIVPPVASVTVSPAAASMSVGVAQQFAAVTQDSAGNTLTGRTVTWTSSNTAVATVNASGVATGVAAGSATITATSEGKSGSAALTVTDLPAGGGVADPNLLPLATTGQAPNFTAYNALKVPNQPSGFIYADPTTNVPVVKVSDANVPGGHNFAVPSYSEGGPHLSLPWVGSDGDTYYTLFVVYSSSIGYFVDFNYTDRRLSNWRAAPQGELRGGFSSNPATPRIFYYVSSGSFQRYNTATNSLANNGNFPSGNLFSRSVNHWYQHDDVDGWHVAYNATSGRVVAWNAVTNEAWDVGAAGDEPHLIRSGTHVILNHASDDNQQFRLSDGQLITIQNQISGFRASHITPVGAYFAATDPGAGREERYDPGAVSRAYLGDVWEVCASHRGGQWTVDNLAGLDAWVVTSSYGCGSGAIKLKSAIGFHQINDTGLDNVRLLGHSYSASAEDGVYFAQPHATISPDGKLVMFGSDMNVANGPVHAFLAIVPTR